MVEKYVYLDGMGQHAKMQHVNLAAIQHMEAATILESASECFLHLFLLSFDVGGLSSDPKLLNFRENVFRVGNINQKKNNEQICNSKKRYGK